MPYHSNLRGPSQVQRTLDRSAALQAIKFTGSAEDGISLLARLRLRHKLKSAMVGGKPQYNRSELLNAYAEHKSACGESPVCFPSRFEPKPPKPKATTLTGRVHEFIRSSPNQRFLGTMQQMGVEMNLRTNQVQGAIQALVKSAKIERIDGGWQVPRRK